MSLWIIIVILLLIEGFFSGSEIALLSADKLSLKKKSQKGSMAARRALDLSKHPERVLSTTLFIVSACVITISTLVSEVMIEWKAILVTSGLVVVFGELIPKTLYRKYANSIAIHVSYPLTIAYYLFYPFTRILSMATHRVGRIVGPMEALLTGKRRTTRDDLRTMIDFGKKDSEIKSLEKKMIRRIFDFRFIEAKDIQIPLVKMEAIDETATVGEALAEFQRHQHSRMAVYSERIDNVVGVLEFTDLFGAKDLQQPVKIYMAHPLYIANTQVLPDVLDQLHQSRRELAIVVDEHGGAIGMLTYEDIFEEIAGNIEDEYDEESTLYREVGPQSWIVQGKMEIAQLNEVVKLDIPEGDYETLGGFLLKQFGRIPIARDELYFTTNAGLFRFTIRKATERHIESVLIDLIEPPKT